VNGWGAYADRDLLLALVMPEIEKVGKGVFAERAGLDPTALRAFLSGRYRTTHHTADKLLTLGLGRPDLVGLVCPEGA
jgi:hypothetical protein